MFSAPAQKPKSPTRHKSGKLYLMKITTYSSQHAGIIQTQDASMTPSESDESESSDESEFSSSMVETGGVALRTTLPKNSPRLFFLESAETGGDIS